MRKWRKAVAMCMAAVMMCSMTACGSGNKESADTAAAPAETKAEGSETAAGESSAAGASSWTPEENVTMIVAYKAGSGTDNTARSSFSVRNQICRKDHRHREPGRRIRFHRMDRSGKRKTGWLHPGLRKPADPLF